MRAGTARAGIVIAAIQPCCVAGAAAAYTLLKSTER